MMINRKNLSSIEALVVRKHIAALTRYEQKFACTCFCFDVRVALSVVVVLRHS